MQVKIKLLTTLLLAVGGICSAQQTSTEGDALVIKTATLPKAYVRQQYRVQLEVRSGILPVTWQMADGSLPTGITLNENGVLIGSPARPGDFRFVVTVTDSGKPAHQRNQELTLRVVQPLLAQWSRQPKVTGHRIEGSIKVTNQTEQDFDLTVIVLAVNEIGRATAVGYQHFTLKQDGVDLEIPFAENLPRGAYTLNVDVVAEVAATNQIYRARLVVDGKLQVQQGP